MLDDLWGRARDRNKLANRHRYSLDNTDFFCVTYRIVFRRTKFIVNRNMKRLWRLFSVSALAGLGMAISSCTTSGGGGAARITKVNPYHLEPGMRVYTQDEMIRNEQLHHLHGAVTSEEFAERFGNYYTVFWNSKDRSPATVRLEYTQANTGPTVHTQEVEVASPRGSNTSKFRVTGQDYTTNGPVTAWKASVVVGGQAIAESKSFLWK